MKTRHSERGQALVLIVFGIIGLIGITALSIDGGNAYFDRRRAQNAADTAAMAAGLAKVRQLPSTTPADAWKESGLVRAETNGYARSGAHSTVTVWQCTEVGADCALPPGAVPSEYIKVSITSVVKTWFAPIVGIQQVTNTVEAIAKAKSTQPTTWYNGAALAAIMPGCKTGGWPNDPFVVTGGAISVVSGTGNVFVNSDCATAYDQGGSSSLTSDSGTCVVGGASSTNTSPAPSHDCNQVDPQKYTLPNPVCTGDGSITQVGGDWVATPGTYDSVFPGVSPAGNLKLQKGIYCFEDGIQLSGGWIVTTDLNNDGAYNNSEGVLFFVPSGNVNINGGVTVHLHAITCHSCGLPDALVGYLFYLPPSNDSGLSLEGGSASYFVGTILAPGSLVSLSGGSTGDSLNLQCQIIGKSVKLSGNGTLNITYDQSVNATTWTSPELLPYK